jgi:predicted signal transduction protein with EAL and GGDEF domain
MSEHILLFQNDVVASILVDLHLSDSDGIDTFDRLFCAAHAESSFEEGERAQVTLNSIDALKIDRSFVGDMATDEKSASIVTAMIGMGKNLHMQVVAEGVETRQQLEMLKEQGCPQAQGYYFSRPVSAEEFGQLLKCRAASTTSA